MAPERFTFAFSSRMTLAFGFLRRARIAAIGPAVPPPRTSTSHSTCERPPRISSIVVVLSASMTGRRAGLLGKLGEIGPWKDSAIVAVGKCEPDRVVADRIDRRDGEAGRRRHCPIVERHAHGAG